jgi:hypothetical protein
VSELQRFQSFVSPEPNSGCWLWAGCCNVDGYGRFRRTGQRKTAQAHRFAYEVQHGPIPAGEEVMHRCDMPACVNPDHLVAGPHAENIRDMHAKGRAGKSGPPRLLSMESILDIRTKRMRLREFAALYGVSLGTAQRAQAGTDRRKKA